MSQLYIEMLELCAKIRQIMRSIFEDYAQSFCQFTSFCSKFIQKMVYQISSASPELSWGCYKKHFVFFWTQCV